MATATTPPQAAEDGDYTEAVDVRQILSQCTDPVCMNYRVEHTASAIRATELAQDLVEMTIKYENLRKQMRFIGGAAQIDVDVGPLPNGDIMTPERFIFRTEQWKNALGTISKLTLEIKKLKGTITDMMAEKEAAKMHTAGLERMLQRFDQPRPFAVFGDEEKRETIEENHRLVDEVERLEGEVSGLKDEVMVLRGMVERRKWNKRLRSGDDGNGEEINN